MWRPEKIFPIIDDKTLLDDQGGSNYVRILMSTLASIFVISLSAADLKVPSLLIIDNIRKHETEIEDLDKISTLLIEEMKTTKKGQMIVTGVDIPPTLLEESKRNGRYYFIEDGKFTL